MVPSACRVYCTACMKHLLCPTTYEQVLQEDPWECFLCSSASRSISDTIVRPRSNWKDKIIDMFRTNCNSVMQPVERSQEKRKIRVLSLFDGLSTGDSWKRLFTSNHLFPQIVLTVCLQDYLFS